MWIKLCGLRDVATARLAVEAGADAIGLNFFARSARSVSRDIAARIVASLPESVEPVGLFVNHALDDILSAVDVCGLKTVQLHGDETPEFLAELAARRPSLRLIRAYRLGAGGSAEMSADLARTAALGVALHACLVDARVEGTYGGSGQVAPWAEVTADRREGWPPLVLAGGLDETNVAAAIRTVRPWGVDTASGIESSPGVTDERRMRAFVVAARGA